VKGSLTADVSVVATAVNGWVELDEFPLSQKLKETITERWGVQALGWDGMPFDTETSFVKANFKCGEGCDMSEFQIWPEGSPPGNGVVAAHQAIRESVKITLPSLIDTAQKINWLIRLRIDFNEDPAED
jgi:hypothetical protein